MATVSQSYTNLAAQIRRDELIIGHLPLVRHVLGKLLPETPAGTDMDNLEAAGTLGLVEAATHFDPSRGTKFESYAYARIRGAILDELRRNCPLPQQMLKQVGIVRRAYELLTPPVTVQRLSASTGLSEDEVADCLGAMRLIRLLSLDRTSATAKGLREKTQETPHAALERAEQQLQVARAIETLPPMERRVVTLYFLEDLRLKEIGKLVGLSESRVSRLLNAALFHLGEATRLGQD